MDEEHRRRRSREGALWVAYGLDLTDADPLEGLERSHDLIAELDTEIELAWDLVRTRILAMYDRWESVNEAIQGVSSNWRIERMHVVDRNLLRVGVWELFEASIPPAVTIDACVELGKTYGSESTPDFVNGLLDQLCTDRDIPFD
ncbi:MAG: transcription antitermination protein NusB [Bradymonadaceae bacterium]